MKFGNWLITEEGINWDGPTGRPYLIPKDRLTESGSGDRSKMYDWLVHLVEKTWITENDVYALNTAFIFAVEHFGVGFSSNLSLVATLAEQQKEIKRK